jgi:hypothetical protein
MAKVPLVPIGRAREAFLDGASFERNRAALGALDATLAASTRRASSPRASASSS